MRLGISTGGGDAPGLNAVIRSAVLSALSRNWEVLGIKRGFAGLMGDDDVVSLTRESVRGIAHLGGTILRTTNRGNPFAWPRPRGDGTYEEIDRSDELISNARQLGIEAIITIGGDGSLAIAEKLAAKGMRMVGVPKTIDNDVACTITTFGFDTAVSTALDAIDKLHTTAESHDRVFVMEVMGRDTGFIALHSGLAGTADVILIPEIPYDIEKVCEKIRARDRAGRHFSIVVVAEGAYPKGEGPAIMGPSRPGQAVRVGGVAERVMDEIEENTQKECRSLVLGDLQFVPQPPRYDRLLSVSLGGAAVRAVSDGKWNLRLALQAPHIVTVPPHEVSQLRHRVELHHHTLLTA